MSRAKTVVVTGASSGIGLAVTKAFLAAGWNVVGNSRSEERLASARQELGSPASLLTIAGDIGQPETAKRLFEAAIERFSRVHVLVNNAGIFKAKPFVDYTEDELDAQLSTNLKGFVYPSQEAVRHMAAHREGHIINVTASIALQPLATVPAVLPIAIKGGINQATRGLALELAPLNIKVSAVAPGIIDTPLYTASMHEFLATLQPIGHIGTTTDVVDAVLYLARAEFTTGVVLPVDGGMSAGRF